MRTDRPDTTAYPQQVCTVLLPLAIHWAVSSAAFMLCDSLIPNRPGADGLIPSALTAVICIPVFMRMHKEQQERQLAGQHVRKRAGQKKKRGAGQQERQQAGQQERQQAGQQERQRASAAGEAAGRSADDPARGVCARAPSRSRSAQPQRFW